MNDSATNGDSAFSRLLPDLDYHEKMKVLVINAGTWIPEKLSLADLVKRKVKRNAAAAARR